MAASTAMQGQIILIWGFQWGWILNLGFIVKSDAARLLEKELAKPGYQPKVIVINSNTDPYQSVEETWRIMRDILLVLYEAQHLVNIVTKSALVLRDSDILAAMTEKSWCRLHYLSQPLMHAFPG
ncbi:MAG: hypothetical protein JSC189_000242 [Candidatus Tokpelaia sp. JSC189]|nr:MAG: hypothetical protein JSC189_000242 [Candidatus Tokpelaia sp. JSC189]